MYTINISHLRNNLYHNFLINNIIKNINILRIYLNKIKF
jgi:hypothetical protein